MKIKEIKSKNDCLGYMLQIQNENQECRADILIEKIGKGKKLILDDYIKILQEDGYINRVNLNDIFITEKGQKGYISPLKMRWLKIKPIILCIITYILGILTPIITDYIKCLIFGCE